MIKIIKLIIKHYKILSICFLSQAVTSYNSHFPFPNLVAKLILTHLKKNFPHYYSINQ